MIKKICLFWLSLSLMFTALPAFGGEIEELFSTIQSLAIERGGYVLCAELTETQKAFAQKNLQEANSKKVYKFQDKDLNIVADRATDRVLLIYQQFEGIDQPGIQNLVGELFIAYEDPTISAHDKVVYWAWGKKGKFTADQFEMAKEKKKKLAILATVKLNSDIKILDKTQTEAKGDAYYIISSDPLLKFFQDS